MPKSQGDSSDVRSQLSLHMDEEQEHGHETVNSQAQFATQLPLTYNSEAWQYQQDADHDVGTGNVTRDQQGALTEPISTTNDLQQLLSLRNGTGENISIVEEQRVITGFESGQIHESELDTSVPIKTDQTEEDGLTQFELRAPTTSRDLTPSQHCATESSGHSDCIGTQVTLPQKHSLDLGIGGCISSRMINIPKDQAQLLEGDDKWYPSLIGVSSRLPTVPLSLLNVLTAQADLASSKPPSTNDHKSLENAKIDLERSETNDTAQSDHGSEDSEGSASEIGSGEWPISQPQSPHHHRLPPNSPPEKEWDHGQRQSKDTMNGRHATLSQVADQEDVTTGSFGAPSEPHNATYPAKDQLSMFPKGKESVDTISADKKANHHQSSESHSYPVNPALSSENVKSARKIEVDRTPYPSKIDSATQLLSTSTSIVPGSFNENPFTPVTQERNQTGSLQTTRDLSEIQDGEFEQNSSEDEALASHAIRPQSRKLSPSLTEFDSRRIKNAQVTRSEVMTIRQHSPAVRKRGRVDLNVEYENEYKRQRTDHDSGLDSLQTSASYHDLDTERKHHRRAFFKELKQNGRTAQTHETGSKPGVDLVGQTPALQRTTIEPHQPRPMPETRPYAHSFAHTGEKTFSSAYHSEDSMKGTTKSNDLYSKFKAGYRSYQGNRKDFDASCRLLKTTRAKTSLHPSLWDAFVYRHYHDYRPYLHVIIEDAGTAMSYTEFFDQILSPGCLRHIITPNNLDTSEVMTTASPSRKVTTFPESQINTSDIPVSNAKPPQDFQALTELEIAESARKNARGTDEEPSNSQHSTQSVRAWLERAAGARSPILGSPDGIGNDNNEDKSRSRALDTAIDDQLAKNIAPRMESEGLTRSVSKHAEPTAHHSAQPKRELNPDARQRPRSSNTGAKPAPKTNVIADTVFKQFARDFDNLPTERVDHTSAPVQDFIDIFRWRKN